MFYEWLHWQINAGKNWYIGFAAPTMQIIVRRYMRSTRGKPFQVYTGVVKYPPYHWTQF